MRSLMVIVMHETFNSFTCDHPTASPQDMKTVGSNFEGVKPLSDAVSVGVVHSAA